MTSRSPRAVATLSFLLVTVAGCGGGSARSATPEVKSSPLQAAAKAYNADQLTQALLTGISGYERMGAAQSGQFSSLAAVQNSNQMQQAVKLDKPQCASSTRAVSQEKAVQASPSALVAFVKGQGQSVSETLMAVGPDVAAQQVDLRVPASCRSFRAKVGGHWSVNTIAEAQGTRIGEGSRTVGVSTTAGGTTVRTWFVVLRSRGYLATITLYGPGVAQSEAVGLARKAYQQAERILP